MIPIQIEENGLVYELNMMTFTADVTYSPKACDEIVIPCSIDYESSKYTVFSILSNAFSQNHAIKSILFPDFSQICIIYGNAFENSSLEKIYIPPHLEILCDGWCSETPNLDSVIVSPKNKKFALADEKYIICKSIPYRATFDSLVFANRNIAHLTIPTFIKFIESYSFQNCKKLKSIEFCDNSNLKSIKKYAFAGSTLCNISIPLNVEKIEDYAFYSCNYLKTINFQKNPKSISIGKLAFFNSAITNIETNFKIQVQKKEISPILKEEQNNTLNEINYINDDFYKVLSTSDKQQFDNMILHYKSFQHLSVEKYYNLIYDIIIFISENDHKANVLKCGLTGIIPSYIDTELKEKSGFIVAINEVQFEKIIGKSRKSLNNSFLRENSILLSSDILSDISSKNKNKLEIFESLISILSKPEIKFNKYFIFSSSFTSEHPIKEALKQDAFFPNNYKFLKKWQDENKMKNILHENKKESNKCKQIAKQLNELTQMIKEKIFESNEQFDQINDENHTESTIDHINEDDPINNEDSKNSVSNDEDEDACENALLQIKKLKELISISEIQSSQNRNSFIDELVEKLYADKCIKEKEMFHKIIEDIINHKKYNSWRNSKALEFGFLIKYCSSAAYYRLFVLLNKKIPSISTINSHFSQSVANREKLLTYSDSIMSLLNQYLYDIEPEISEYISEYYKRFHENLDIKNFKINICLGCDAASFTPFNQKKTKEVDKSDDNEEIKKEKKEIKKKMFQNIVKGEFEKNEQFYDRIDELYANNNEDKDEYFFSIMIHPYIWKFPIIPIHLGKSLNGHFSAHEAKSINQLLKIINDHKNYNVKYFVADGDTPIDDFHISAFEIYQENIPKVINGEMTLQEFISYVKEKCKILPVYDLLHDEKSGRNRIINNVIKFSDKSDKIEVNDLKSSLGIHDRTLNDKSSIGRMNDKYPIELFQIKNAIKEFKNKSNASGLYILIYSILLEIFKNNYMDLNFRIALSELSFYVIIKLFQNIPCLSDEIELQKNYKSPEKFVYFKDKIGIIQMINTTICLISIFTDPELSFLFGTERVTSHIEEEYFGEYRDHFIGYSTPQNALRFAVKETIALDLERDLDVNFSKSKSDNYSGTHLDFIDKNGNKNDIYSIPCENIIFNRIKEISFDLYKTGIGEKPQFDHITYIFLDYISQFFENHQFISSNNYSISKGADIIERIELNNSH